MKKSSPISNYLLLEMQWVLSIATPQTQHSQMRHWKDGEWHNTCLNYCLRCRMERLLDQLKGAPMEAEESKDAKV